MSDRDHDQATRLVEAGRRKAWTSLGGQPGGMVNPPVWRGSTHLYEDMADLAHGRPNADGHFYYGRRGGPTQWALADALTAIEPGADGTELFPSGVAAIATTLLALLSPGDELLLTDNAYEPTRSLAFGMLQRMGVTTRTFDPIRPDTLAAAIGDATKVVMLENPGSLTIEVCDVPALTAIARERGVIAVIDNTWASPLGFPALERGCDISVMSLTKHVGGHSDLMMGSVAARRPLLDRVRQTAQSMGQVVSPDDAALALRGLRTMGVRLERTTASALQVARWLAGREEVSAVLCPMLPGAPGHETWRRDFTGGCGLFTFVLADADVAARARLVDALDLFGIGYSWGGFESLAIPVDPARIRDHGAWPATIERGSGLGVRLAIGLEDPDDLIRDLERGFSAMEHL
ncbi:cystathionine beta-lyase [Erythrobacter arachoides]|uniref:Cystathionine beta-lyase n=1 Tax=Aurantiacibacter arachoides TaxID=1850444 RepID=A0A845A4J6_9SPHN|nr:cystathionine beta-lyase [Aurantiacibacter arachoides]MXO92509.1 cystathionine beta-lyase [Aurantiacibacter arachoides]GGD56604.1 cystathionine beta-lyase [Aurantiacibacter arachoides]